MSTKDKCPGCGADQEIPFNVYGYKCGTDHTGELQSDLCRERVKVARLQRRVKELEGLEIWQSVSPVEGPVRTTVLIPRQRYKLLQLTLGESMPRKEAP